MKKGRFEEFVPSAPLSYPDKKTKELFEVILKLKNKEEAAKFFRDLLTIGEINEFSNRWLAAKLLSRGLSYAKVAQKLKMSTTTVARIAHWLNHGLGGYKLILKRISEK